MNQHKGGREGSAQPGFAGLLLRGLIVTGLVAVIALAVLVRPIPEPTVEAPSTIPTTVIATAQPAPTEEEETATPSPAATPTLRPSPTLTPSLEPSPTAMPIPTETISPEPTATAEPVAPEPTPTAMSQPSALAGRVEQGTYASAVTGRQESYRIYLPPGYDQDDRRYPVLYLLHGWPYDETHWDLLGVDEAADAGIVNGVYSPFIIVLPGADKDGLYVTTSGGAGSFEEQLVNELMPHIDAAYRSIQTRDARAIGGISRGGVWSLEIAFTHPDAFGIVGAHSPALSANRAPSVYDPFTLMSQPGVDALRIYLSAGDTDWARQKTVELHQALTQQGIVSQLAIHEGAHRDQLWQQHLTEYLAFYTAGW